MVLLIIIVTCGVSFAAFSNSSLLEKYQFSPFKISRNHEYIRWISGGFLHADQMHLFFNMLTLYFTADFLEAIFRPWEVIIFYLVAIAVAGIPDFIKNKDNPYYAAIGASGAVSAGRCEPLQCAVPKRLGPSGQLCVADERAPGVDDAAAARRLTGASRR